MNRDEGKLSPLWIRTIANAQKKPAYESRPPQENRGQETTGESDGGLLPRHQLHDNWLHLKDLHQQSGDLLQPWKEADG